MCLPRLGGWSNPAVGLLLAQMVPGGRAAGPTLLSRWLEAALSPAGHEIRASRLGFNLHAEGVMVFSRLRGKHKAGSDIPCPGILEASCSCWLTPSLHFSRMCAHVAMLPRSVFPMSRCKGFVLSHRFSTPPSSRVKPSTTSKMRSQPS